MLHLKLWHHHRNEVWNLFQFIDVDLTGTCGKCPQYILGFGGL